jgi:hypothetical protein
MLRWLVCLCVVTIGCKSSTRNNGDAGPDASNECTEEGAHRCTGSSYEICTDSLWVTETDCLQGCVDTLGCVACTPNERFCKDGNVWVCDENGNPGMMVETCTGVNTCEGGGCVDACANAATNKSYIGCEYWAVDLDNAIEVWGVTSQATCTQMFSGTVTSMPVCFKTMGPFTTTAGACDPAAAVGGPSTCPTGFACGAQSVCISDAQHSPFAIVVSNPQTKDVNVTVTGPGGETMVRVISAGQVASLVPNMGGIPDQSIDGTIQARHAYKITSDLPIVAYQFNPLDNVNVFSNDASLLIPRTSFDIDYYGMSHATLNRRAAAPGKDNYYGYLTVVAWQDNTQIAVTPTTAVQSSTTQATIAAGATTNFTLDAFEVLQLQAAPGVAPAGDLTGTKITSTNNTTFGVFGGHEATAFGSATPPDNQHTQGPCCADHLEEMMFPASTWGKTFALARSQQRSSEPDVLRILAQKPNTIVTFTPPPATGTCGTLGPGQFCEVKVAVDTEIVSTEPVLVGHYLEAAIWTANNGTSVGNGDPSMAIAVPVEQFRKSYTILVPAAYEMNYISLAAAATGGVTIDGMPVTLSPFGGGGTHRVARIPVAAGQHTIQCADGCGVTVYGYSQSVSYMFAGGLDLKAIVIF